MRIIILSISLLFCAFTAQSQVLKSAGVWYFLDVDSMTARPAVLPNGTELAYVVGTKKIYYWDRGTSTWTEYSTGGGSSFNRDSIYFDSSIVGGGTVSDPWGVDSTLFATIAAVGDSIAAALVGYPPGSGTANYIAKWATNTTLGLSNLFDNNTYTGVISRPWKFGEYTTAGLPTGVTGYTVYNTTTNGPAWYQGSRWAYGLESTFNTGTSGRYPRFDANGQIINGLLSESSNVISVTSNNLFQFGKWANGGARPTMAEAQVGYNQLNGTLEYSTGSNVYTVGHWIPATSTDIYFSSNIGVGTSTTTGKVNISGTGGNNNLLRILSTSSGSYASLDMFNSSSDQMQFNVIGSATSVFGLVARSGNLTYSGSGGVGIMAYNASAPIKFFTGGLNSTNQRLEISSVGTLTQLNTTTGLFLASGTTAQTPTEAGGLIRFNADSTLYQIYSGGVRSYIATRSYVRSVFSASTWLKTELQAGRDVDITGTSSTDFRLRSNTRTQFDGIFKVGADSIMRVKGTGLVKNPGSSIFSSSFFGGGALELRQQVGNFQPILSMELDSNRNRSFLTIRKYNGNSVNILATSDGSDLTGALVFEAQLRKDTTSTAGFSFTTSKIDAFNNGSQPTNADNIRFIPYTSFETAGQQANGNWYFGSDKHTIIGTSGDSIYHNGKLRLQGLGAGTAITVLGKTSSNEVIPVYLKRDTTIFLTGDTNYDFSAAVTTAQIASRYNRVIIHMTLTSGVGSDKTTTLHTPDANLMQCEILIRGTDNTGTYDNEIAFGTNNAISSDGTDASGYTLAQGQGLHVRVVYNGSAYKYIYY